MEFDVCQTNTYFGPNHSKIWPAPPRLCEPEFGPMSTDLAIEQCRAAHDAAHDIQGDRPEAFADVVGDFLRRGMAFLVTDTDTMINL